MIELESRKTNSRLSANSCENSVERRNFLNPTQKHFNPKEYCKSIEEPDSGKLVPILWKIVSTMRKFGQKVSFQTSECTNLQEEDKCV